MPTYTQANRVMRVDTSLGADVLLLAGFRGREGVSTPYSFELDMLSEDFDIKADDMLRKPAWITLDQQDGSKRHIHGLVRRFLQLGVDEDLAYYRAEIVPWLWFLSLSHGCKIFQNKSVLDIIEQVFTDLGYTDYQIECTANYAKRDYCVQYRESHLDFVSRLMEEEGIFYFFRHTGTKHTLVLADNNSSVDPCAGQSSARVVTQKTSGEDAITYLQHEAAVFVGKVTLSDFDYLQPSLTLKSSISGDGKEEIHDYEPGLYVKPEQGERYARMQLEAREAVRQVIRGQGTCRFLQSGFRFDLEEYYRADLNKAYMILEVTHNARSGDYRSSGGEAFDYSNEFLAIPHDVPYRPLTKTAKPVVRGSQTAVVVGKSGEEIWVDKHGRVKVQFHWDRDGRKDENSSCWVRVSSSWAGKAWGTIQIPRIGQEVIVDFLEGDPDLPIITGRVYNAEQVPPYELPKNAYMSGTKSRSTKKGGTEDFNEFRMEDAKGKELIYIHAQKDKTVMVENDRNEEVGHDETILIKNDRTEEVENNEKITIGVNRTEEVGGNETIKIKGNRKEEVGGNETITIKGKRTEKVTGKESIKIDAKRQRQVASSDTLKVGTSRKSKIGTSDTLKVGTKLTIKAGTQILLKVGANSIKIDNAGITIKGIQVKIKGTAKADLSAPMTNVKGTGMLTSKAPMHQVKGDAILMLKGGITMIN